MSELIIAAVREDMNRLRGRLFSTVESIGLPDKQESAFKSVIRHVSYDVQANLEATIRREDS